MAKKKIKTEKDLRTSLKRETMGVVSNFGARAYEILSNEINRDMAMDKPRMYERTGEFEKQLRRHRTEKWGNSGYKQEIQYDPDRIRTFINPHYDRDTKKTVWGTHVSIENEEIQEGLYQWLDEGTSNGLIFMTKAGPEIYMHPGYNFTEDAKRKIEQEMFDGSIITKKHKVHENDDADRTYYSRGIVIRKKTMTR